MQTELTINDRFDDPKNRNEPIPEPFHSEIAKGFSDLVEAMEDYERALEEYERTSAPSKMLCVPMHSCPTPATKNEAPNCA